MQVTFHNSTRVDRKLLHQLGDRNNHDAATRFLTQYGLLVLSAGVVLLSQSWWLVGPAIVVCGLLITSCFAPLHECSHKTAFASNKGNELVGWLAGLPLLFPPAAYREFHFEHHRHTHDPTRDPEIAAGGERFAMWPVYAHEYLAVASGLLLLALRVVMLLALVIGPNQWIWQKLMPFVRPTAQRKAIRQARAYAVVYSLLVAGAGLWAPQAIWLLLSLVIGHSMLALYLSSEHTGLPVEGTIFDRTRTTLTNRVVRYFMWNMPFHAEHHAYPSVPFHALPELHQHVQGELQHTAEGYVRLHAGVFRRLKWLGRRPASQPTSPSSTQPRNNSEQAHQPAASDDSEPANLVAS